MTRYVGSKNFLRTFAIWAVILCFMNVMGCATTYKTGKDFDVTKAAQIKRGVTTKAEVLTMLGEPLSKGQSSEGEKWVYEFSETSQGLFSGYQAALGGTTVNQATKKLTIIFAGNVVKEFNTEVQGGN